MGSLVDDENNVKSLMKSMPMSYRGLLVALKGQANMTLQTLITNLLQEETLMKNPSPSSDIVYRK